MTASPLHRMPAVALATLPFAIAAALASAPALAQDATTLDAVVVEATRLRTVPAVDTPASTATINLDGERMVSLGFLASGETGEFEVPARLMDEGYRIVDISDEPDDGDPTHSGVSLARGELA